MKSIRVLIISLISILLIAGTFVFAQAVYGETETLDVVLDDNYPPYIFYNENGQPQGILVDQWLLFEEKTGIDVQLHPMDWSAAQEAMKAGEYDIIDTMFYSKVRDEVYDFTEKYETIETAIFFQDSIGGITDIRSLKGFQVGAKDGDYSINQLMEAGVSDIKVYPSYEDMVIAASKGELKIFIIDVPPGLYYMNKYGIENDFRYTEPVYSEGFRRAVMQGDAETLAMINQGFEQFTDKELKAISNKWFGNQIISVKYLPQLLWGLGILVLIVVGTLGWTYALRRKVKSKTAALSGALEKIETERSKLQGLVNSIPDLIYVLDREGLVKEFLSANVLDEEIAKLTGEPNQNIAEIFRLGTKNTLHIHMEQAFHKGLSDAIEFKIQSLSGGLRYLEARFSKISEENVLAIIRDVTEKTLTAQELYQFSIMDQLTEVYNRNYFEQTTKEWQDLEKERVGLFMVDIDGLKLVNDTLGHDVGDQYLCTIAQKIKLIFPKPGMIFRVGGDEFAVIVFGWDETEMLKAKEQLIDQVRGLNAIGYPIPFSISIGFSMACPTCHTIADMIKNADDYMYRQKLFHRQSQRSKTIETLSAMLAERDFITQGHSRRMSYYIKKMAMKLNFPDNLLPGIELFADFHDIGKIGISDTILFKAGRLTDQEFADMKRHAEIGFRIAEASPDLASISEWIYKHHEHWNGSGYPFGIRGTEIPLACRILSIVDAYDAMTNDRPYRTAMDQQSAIDELKRCAGTQFDPDLVEIFVEILHSETN
jgi:diguanylate cyclase (GGDEF)-like protein